MVRKKSDVKCRLLKFDFGREPVAPKYSMTHDNESWPSNACWSSALRSADGQDTCRSGQPQNANTSCEANAITGERHSANKSNTPADDLTTIHCLPHPPQTFQREMSRSSGGIIQYRASPDGIEFNPETLQTVPMSQLFRLTPLAPSPATCSSTTYTLTTD